MRKCYAIPAFSGGPLHKGTQTKVAHKRAEVLHQPYNLGGPQTRRQSKRWPTSGRKCYISPAFSGGPLQKGPQTKVAHKRAEVLHHPYVLGRSPNKGTKSKVAHKWAEVLHQPYILGSPRTRGQSQRWPTSGRKCYITPAFSEVPYKRGRKQRWPTSGPKCYISPTISGFPNQGDKAKGGPQVGGSATSALRSRGSPNKGTKPKVAHKWAEVLCHPCVLGRSPTEGDANKSGPQKSGSATSALQSRGSPNKGTKSKVAHKWAEVLH